MPKWCLFVSLQTVDAVDGDDCIIKPSNNHVRVTYYGNRSSFFQRIYCLRCKPKTRFTGSLQGYISNAIQYSRAVSTIYCGSESYSEADFEARKVRPLMQVTFLQARIWKWKFPNNILINILYYVWWIRKKKRWASLPIFKLILSFLIRKLHVKVSKISEIHSKVYVAWQATAKHSTENTGPGVSWRNGHL